MVQPWEIIDMSGAHSLILEYLIRQIYQKSFNLGARLKLFSIND